MGRSNFVQSSDSAKAADVNVSMIRKHPPSRLNMMFCDLCNAFTDRITISCSDCMIARSVHPSKPLQPKAGLVDCS